MFVKSATNLSQTRNVKTVCFRFFHLFLLSTSFYSTGQFFPFGADRSCFSIPLLLSLILSVFSANQRNVLTFC